MGQESVCQGISVDNKVQLSSAVFLPTPYGSWYDPRSSGLATSPLICLASLFWVLYSIFALLYVIQWEGSVSKDAWCTSLRTWVLFVDTCKSGKRQSTPYKVIVLLPNCWNICPHTHHSHTHTLKHIHMQTHTCKYMNMCMHAHTHSEIILDIY